MDINVHVWVHEVHEGVEHQGMFHQILTLLHALKTQGDKMARTMQEVKDELDLIKSRTGDYIAKRDAIDEQLKADLAAALANAGVSVEEQADIDAAFTKAEEALALVTPPTVDPVDPNA